MLAAARIPGAVSGTGSGTLATDRGLAHGGERLGHDGLHRVLAERADEAGLHCGGLQHVDGFVQIEIALAPQAGSGLGARDEDFQGVRLCGDRQARCAIVVRQTSGQPSRTRLPATIQCTRQLLGVHGAPHRLASTGVLIVP